LNALEPPERVYLDSSVIAVGISPGSAHSTSAGEFFNRLSADVREQYGLDHWHDDLFVHARWLAHGDAQLQAFINRFAIVYDLPSQQERLDRVLSLMAYYNLKSYDAVHLATMQYYGIAHFATCDRHFSAIDGLSLFLVRDS
jgi:predicted nucleic acid-binding protein